MKKFFIYGFLTFAFATSASAQIEVATFENLDLPDNSYWCGELDEEDEDMGFGTSYFRSGSFEFNNFYWPEYYTWSFFGYSSRTETTFSTMTTDQFNSITGCGAGNSRIYGIAFPASYMGNTIMEVGDGETPVAVPGMEIVNTAWVVDCILNGDGYEGKFETGDWMKLTLTGYNDDDVTGTRDYYLADYRSDDPADHLYIDTWTWIDLSELGEVTSIRFNIDSSKKNAYGVTTPTYVCIDNVGITEDTSAVGTVVASDLALNFIAGSRHLAVSGARGDVRYSVTDLSGKTVQTGQISERNASVDLSSLAGGIYIVTVRDSVSAKSLKIIRPH